METSRIETPSSDMREVLGCPETGKTEKDTSEWSSAVESICSKSLQLHPDCLEFAPSNISSTIYSPFLSEFAREFFVLGTYFLVEAAKNSDEESDDSPQQKRGGLSLFRLRGDKLLGQEDTSRDYGVYDLKFLPHHPIFAASTTNGSILICQLEEIVSEETGQKDLQVKELASHHVIPENLIIPSIAWFPLQHESDKTRILAITVEDGRVFLLRFKEDLKSFEILNFQEPLHQHVDKTPYYCNNERAWCCAFSSPFPNTVFSGGDDNHLRQSTLNILPKDIAEFENFCIKGSENSFLETLSFSEGVTSILPFAISDNDNTTNLLLVGSYDSHIRLCQINDGSNAILLDLDLGGGVYRLKFLHPYPPIPNQTPHSSFQVLACCMHAGTKILEVKQSSSGTWSITILAEVKDNKSMCYAADVQPLPISPDGEVLGNGGEERICVSSSFEDNELSIWRFIR